MLRSKQYSDVERELMQAEMAVLQKQSARGPVRGCPGEAALRRFAAGREDREEIRNELVAHLADCSHCIRVMGNIREQRIARSAARRLYIRRSALAFAAVIVIAVSILIWNRTPDRTQLSNQIAVVDLRVMSPVRGGYPVTLGSSCRSAAKGLTKRAFFGSGIKTHLCCVIRPIPIWKIIPLSWI
jgi:hypothetical protein